MGIRKPSKNADHLNRPVRMTDAAKAAMWEAIWTPWGSPHAITGTTTLDARFGHDPGKRISIDDTKLFTALMRGALVDISQSPRPSCRSLFGRAMRTRGIQFLFRQALPDELGPSDAIH